jgi:hypothetical protein
MKYFNVLKQIYVMYLPIKKSYFRSCDGFSNVEDENSHRISIHTNNNTSALPTEIIL